MSIDGAKFAPDKYDTNLYTSQGKGVTPQETWQAPYACNAFGVGCIQPTAVVPSRASPGYEIGTIHKTKSQGLIGWLLEALQQFGDE